MKTVLLAILIAALAGCANSRIYAICDKRIDKDGKVHYHCDKKQMIGFGIKF